MKLVPKVTATERLITNCEMPYKVEIYSYKEQTGVFPIQKNRPDFHGIQEYTSKSIEDIGVNLRAKK